MYVSRSVLCFERCRPLITRRWSPQMRQRTKSTSTSPSIIRGRDLGWLCIGVKRLAGSGRGNRQALSLTLIGDFTQCWEGSEREPVGQRMTALQQNVDKLSYLEDIAA